MMDGSGNRFFPSAEAAQPDGLLALGGDLSVPRLLEAYRHGIFPWPTLDLPGLMAWWSPDPRGILELDRLRVSRRLRRTLRSGQFEVSSDRAFSEVVEGCATAQDRRSGTWITSEMCEAYVRFHQHGWAHSVEVWQSARLVGGIYGVAIGGFFAGESMFYLKRDASKVALVALVRHLRACGYELLDVQFLTPHLAAMGAVEITRSEYLAQLAVAIQSDTSWELDQGVLTRERQPTNW